MKTKLIFAFMAGLVALLLIGASTTEVNLSNVPLANDSLALTNYLLVLTNATKARRATFQQVKDLIGGGDTVWTNSGGSIAPSDQSDPNASVARVGVVNSFTNSLQSDWPYYEYGAALYGRTRSDSTSGNNHSVFAFNDSKSSIHVALTSFADSSSTGQTNIAGLDLLATEGNSGVHISRYIEAQNPGYGANPALTESAILMLDSRETGFPILVGRTNNGTTVFKVDSDGKVTAPTYTLTGSTNQVKFGGTNTAPVSAVAPTKWISVQVAGLTNQFRLPLYE